MEIKRIIAMAMMVCVGIAVWRMGAMQEANEVVIFKPSSGEPIKVPLNMARLFEAVNDAVSFGYEEELVFEIPVPMSATTLRELLEDLQWVLNLQRAYNEWQRMTPEQVCALGSRVRAQRAEKEARAMVARTYTALDLETLIESYKAAVYLDSPELIEKYAREIAGMVTSDEALKVLAQNNPALIALISDNSIKQDVKRGIFRYMPQTWIEFTARAGRVQSVAISADGNTVVTGSDYEGAKIVQWKGSRSQWVEQYMIPYKSLVEPVAISADGNTVVAGSWDNTAKIVKLNGSQWVEQYRIRHGNRIKSVAISADGNTVVTGSFDNTAKIVQWNGSQWVEQYMIPYTSQVESVAISADGNTVVTGSDTAKIMRRNGSEWEERYAIRNEYLIKSVAISAYGNTVVMGSFDTAKIVQWDGSQSEWAEQYTIRHGSWINSVGISADGNTVVTGSGDDSAKIVRRNGSQWEEQYTIRHGDPINSVAISADGNTVVTRSADNTAKIVQRDGSRSQWAERYTIRHKDLFLSVAISEYGNTVVTGWSDGTRKIVRLLPADTFDQALLLQLLEWAKRKTPKLNIAVDGWSRTVWNRYSDADRALLRSTYPGMLPAYVPGHAFKKVVFEGIID